MTMAGGGKPVVVGIAGGTGSGKTALATHLAEKYVSRGLCLLSQDSYYRDCSHLEASERERLNYDTPDAIEFKLLSEHVQSLVRGVAVAKPIYEFVSHTRRSATELIRPGSIILVEGLFALWDSQIRSLMDLKIYVDAEADFRFIRRLRRDVHDRGRTMEAVIEQYLASVRPMHQLYIEPTKAFADIVLHNNGTQEKFLSAAIKVISKALGESGQSGMNL